tara:strand:+ start:811 stop:966 length:156 start_codon:yes stop_codon:yes gene_type:complete
MNGGDCLNGLAFYRIPRARAGVSSRRTGHGEDASGTTMASTMAAATFLVAA